MSSGHTPSRAPEPGESLLHYEIVKEIGRGGMGRVLLARDSKLDRKVALKILPPEFVSDPERLTRFQREAKTLAALNHPSIVTIYGVEEFEGLHFLIMELVEGQTLKKLIPADGIPVEVFFGIAEAVAEALHAASERGIAHRDLKPENIMVTTSGRVKLLDFGLAKGVPENTLARTPSGHYPGELTQEGVVMGTVPYMSPEQVQGLPADHRSDIFSMGIIFYEMLTGNRPFQGDTAAQLISAILRDNPSSVTRLRTEIPRHLGRIVRQCLEKDPANRFQTARTVHNQLRDLRHEIELEQALESGGPRRSDLSSTPEPTTRSPAEALASGRIGLFALLGLVFLLNWVETSVEGLVHDHTGVGIALGHQLARAAYWLEGSIVFENHDVTNLLAVYGYSISYFFVFPLLALAIALALVRRTEISGFRVLCLAVAVDYAISLPFFIFFPVVERWAFPDSGAILLSDLWSSRLIEAIRPISGLDNCFPSFHVSLTVILVLVAYLYRVRFRHAVAALGATIVLSTFVLGIHWIADMVAGLAVAVLSVAIAQRLDRRLDRRLEHSEIWDRLADPHRYSAPTADL